MAQGARVRGEIATACLEGGMYRYNLKKNTKFYRPPFEQLRRLLREILHMTGCS